MVKPVLYYPVAPVNATLLLGFGFDHTTDDDPAQGNMTAWSANAKVALISDGADVRTATIYGMDNAGTPVPISEAVVMTGASEVLSVATFSKVWGVVMSATDASRTVLVKQGTGGTTRGTIGLLKKLCFLFVSAGTVKANGIALPDLAAGQNYGVWRKLTWALADRRRRRNLPRYRDLARETYRDDPAKFRERKRLERLANPEPARRGRDGSSARTRRAALITPAHVGPDAAMGSSSTSVPSWSSKSAMASAASAAST
jgi:hypothetical protein